MIDKQVLRPESMPVFGTEDALPTQAYKDSFKEIYAKFFGAPSVAEYAENLSSLKRPVRRDELGFHLRVLHFHALNSIFEVYEAKGFTPSSPSADTFREMCEKIPVNSETV